MPPVVMPPVLPVGLPPVVPLPLPKLAKGQAVLPSQTASANAKLIQAKLISLGFLKAADVPASQVGIYGPKTTAAVTAFQKAANAYLAQSGQSFILPNAGVTVSKAKPLGVDGKWGAQTNDVAALAHPPNTVGALWGAFGAPPMPMPASPLPGVIPPMMPAALDSRVGLAARLLGNLSEARHGQEDRTLVSMFQAQQGLRASGYYQPETALELARLGFVPPPPRYWPSSGRGKSKKNYRNAILRFAASDPQRKEEWELAARLAA
jgi:peptidoglycan hydrolase-like protein with peptidoglycan-binding domain